MSGTEDKAAEGLQSVVLTMQIVEHVARAGRGAGVTALATALGTSKSRIHRHLQTLVAQGFVYRHDDSERYELGHRLVSLAQTIFDNAGLIRAVQDPLLELRDRLGHSAVASQMTPDGMLVIATVPGRAPIEIGVRVGSLLPFHGSAQGKCAAAASTPAFQQRILDGELEALTWDTIIEPDRLAQEFSLIRERGWADAPNETLLGLNTLASPLRDGAGIVCGAVGIVDLIPALPSPPKREHVAAIIETARKISAGLGYQESESRG